MQWIEVNTFPLSEDLSGFARNLQQRGVPYRITEEGGSLHLWVTDEQLAAELRRRFMDNPNWFRGVMESPESDQADQILSVDSTFTGVVNALRYPLTLLFIGLGIAGAGLVWLDPQLHWVHWFTMQDFVVQGQRIGFYSLSQALAGGEYWRLLTPVFLHFGLFHILFNAMWLWEFGRRIELQLGFGRYLIIILVISVLSNLSQYLWQGPSLFGGLSGLLYGLLGFIWMRQRFYPGSIEALPIGIIGFMLIWLVACMTGLVGFVMGNQIANAAHLGGLLAGMAIGYAPLWLQKAGLSKGAPI